jgi:hypothetical protein
MEACLEYETIYGMLARAEKEGLTVPSDFEGQVFSFDLMREELTIRRLPYHAYEIVEIARQFPIQGAKSLADYLLSLAAPINEFNQDYIPWCIESNPRRENGNDEDWIILEDYLKEQGYDFHSI